jgi:hypothetical protein
VAKGGKPRGGVPIEWDDRADRDYFTDKPAWDCYGALVLKAAYDDRGATGYPATAENWNDNPILRNSLSDPDSKYTHLLNDVEFGFLRSLTARFARKPSREQKL